MTRARATDTAPDPKIEEKLEAAFGPAEDPRTTTEHVSFLGPRSRRLTAVEALAGAMAEIQAVRKTGLYDAAGTRYSFRGVDAVVNAAGPAFRKFGVIPVPQLASIERRDTKTSRGNDTRETTVEVNYLFYGPDGSYVTVTVPGEALDTSDKGTAKAMSVAYRIALLQLLAIPTDDPDPDEERIERGRSPEQAPRHPDEGTVQWWAARIAACSDVETARELWREMAAAQKAGRLSANIRLKAQMADRIEVLTAEAAQAEGTPEPDQSGSTQTEPEPPVDDWPAPPSMDGLAPDPYDPPSGPLTAYDRAMLNQPDTEGMYQRAIEAMSTNEVALEALGNSIERVGRRGVMAAEPLLAEINRRLAAMREARLVSFRARAEAVLAGKVAGMTVAAAIEELLTGADSGDPAQVHGTAGFVVVRDVIAKAHNRDHLIDNTQRAELDALLHGYADAAGVQV